MKIRTGSCLCLKTDGTFDSEFYDILADYEERPEQAARTSILPDHPDMNKVEAFAEYVNRKAIEGE